VFSSSVSEEEKKLLQSVEAGLADLFQQKAAAVNGKKKKFSSRPIFEELHAKISRGVLPSVSCGSEVFTIEELRPRQKKEFKVEQFKFLELMKALKSTKFEARRSIREA
jgi:hypothetical protein